MQGGVPRFASFWGGARTAPSLTVCSVFPVPKSRFNGVLISSSAFSSVALSPSTITKWAAPAVVTLQQRSLSKRSWIRKFKGLDVEEFRWRPPNNKKVVDPDTRVSKHRNIRVKAKKHLIFPDVLPDLFTPRFMLKVEYPTTLVRKGSPIPFKEAASAPTVTWDKDKTKGKLYTLLMTSPDEPSGTTIPPSRGGPRGTEYLHWLVVNIPGSALEKGETVCTYEAPVPSQSSAVHRYVFLLFEQKEGNLNLNVAQRYPFNTARLKEEYSLEPESMAFFRSTRYKSFPPTPSDLLLLGEPLKQDSLPPLRILPKSRQYLDVTKW